MLSGNEVVPSKDIFYFEIFNFVKKSTYGTVQLCFVKKSRIFC